NMDPMVVVLAAGLQQQHRDGRVGGEPVRQQAAGGAGADDDVIIGAEIESAVVLHVCPFAVLFDRALAATLPVIAAGRQASPPRRCLAANNQKRFAIATAFCFAAPRLSVSTSGPNRVFSTMTCWISVMPMKRSHISI